MWTRHGAACPSYPQASRLGRPRPASAGPAPCAVSRRCTTERETAHRTITRRVLYRWHPWAGRLVRVRSVVEKAGTARARCALDGAAPGLWQEVPLWMFDRVACAGTRVEERAQVDLATLCRLWHRSCRMRWVRLPRRAQDGSPMTRIGERPMRDRHGAHRRRGNGSDQLDLFAQAESSSPEDTPTWCALPGRTRRKATELMVRLMLDHARDPRDPGVGGHDV